MASFSKKQPFEVVFYFVVRGGLNYALLCSCEAKPKQKSSLFVSTFLFFLGGGRGFYLRSACSYEQSEVERRFPLCRAMHSQLPKADPPPTPLHVRDGDTALLTQSVAVLKLAFSRCGSRRLKFANLNVKR